MDKTIHYLKPISNSGIPFLYYYGKDWGNEYPGTAMEYESNNWYKLTIFNAPKDFYYQIVDDKLENYREPREAYNHVTSSEDIYIDNHYKDASDKYTLTKQYVSSVNPCAENLLDEDGTLYLVCFKGTSIRRSIFDRLVRIFTKDKYTHVGLATDITEDENGNVSYYAARYDAGVQVYTEPKDDLDFYPIHLKSPIGINKFFEYTRGQYGSFVKDILKPELANTPALMFDLTKSSQHYWRHPDKSEPGWGTCEWVACALSLGLPYRYTIEKLIAFANMEK